MKSVSEVDSLADSAHAGQVDKIGVPYIEHVRAVAAGLAPLGDELVKAGLLHDILEDTDWTAERLRESGISARVVEIVEAVTNVPGTPYEEKIGRITADPQATLVKIADNAHNSHPARAAQLPADKRERLAAKYRSARAQLWPAARPEDIRAIVRVVNPSLLAELSELQTAYCGHDECAEAVNDWIAAGRPEPAYERGVGGVMNHLSEVLFYARRDWLADTYEAAVEADRPFTEEQRLAYVMRDREEKRRAFRRSRHRTRTAATAGGGRTDER